MTNLLGVHNLADTVHYEMPGSIADWEPSINVRAGRYESAGSRGLPVGSNNVAGVERNPTRTLPCHATPDLEVWPESHWPGFALRQADVLQSYTA